MNSPFILYKKNKKKIDVLWAYSIKFPQVQIRLGDDDIHQILPK